MRAGLVLIALAVWCAGGGADIGAAVWPALVARAHYELESTVSLNDAARSHADVSYKIRARLALLPLTDYADLTQPVLLHFRLEAPKLYLKGKHMNADYMPYESVWDSYSDSSFYALWNKGFIEKAFFDPEDLPDVLNYKKSLVSLFQFQAEQGEFNETDVSGQCSVLYETISKQVFRKIKRVCEYESEGLVFGARRVARYSVGEAGELATLHAEEVLRVGALHADAGGLKARAWHALRRAGSPLPGRAPPAALPAALRQLPAALQPLPLALAPPPPLEDDPDLSSLLEEHGSALEESEAGAGGTLGTARAVLAVLPALRRADTAALEAALGAAPAGRLPALARLLGLAGSGAAAAAAARALQLAPPEPPRDLALHYLSGLALAPAPHAAALRAALRLARRARDPALVHAALLSAAAAAARLPPHHDEARAVRDLLVGSLARCSDAACRAPLLAALHNLRRGDTASLLLAHAEQGELGALVALGALPPASLSWAALDRLQEVALDERVSLEARGAALELVVRRRAELPAALVRVMQALYSRGPHELRRVLWQRMAQLAPQHVELARLPQLVGPALRGWDAAAHGGSSSVLARELGWAAGGWRAVLDSAQLAAAGVLRRGVVQLQALDNNNNTFDALAVEVWTRGLEAFSGGNAEEGDSESVEEPAAGLALSVGGARLPELVLFSGQAELLGHVWAGTASTATPVVRAALPLAERESLVPLAGGAVLQARAGAGGALALDAAAHASLWQRSARAALQLRAAAALHVRAGLRTAWAELRAELRAGLQPRLAIAADLDLYSRVALCVRVRSAPHEWERGVELRAAGGARRLRVVRRRRERGRAEGRTLALGAPNDHTCRTLRADDDHDD